MCPPLFKFKVPPVSDPVHFLCFFLPIKRGVGDSVVVLAIRGLEEAGMDVSHCDQQERGEESRIIRGIPIVLY